MRTLILILALVASASAHADQLFKCKYAGGRVEYRDHPCDGDSGEKIKVNDNSVGTGDSLGAIRERDAQFKARQTAKREAEDKVRADQAAAAERAFQDQRAHQDRQELTNAIREGNNQRATDNYNSNLIREREARVKANAASTPAPAPTPSRGSSIAPARCKPGQGTGNGSTVCANR